MLLSAALVVVAIPVPPASAHDGFLPGGTVVGPGSGDTDTAEEPPPGDKEGGEGDDTGDTDPLLLHTGDFRLEVRDLIIPARGIPIEINRTYRSRSRYNSMFGYGWDFNFNMRLRKRSNGDVVILTGKNRRNEFELEGGTYQAPPGVYGTLVQNADGSFTLTKKHGEVYAFDVDGKLITISDRNGNAMLFTYDLAGKLPVTGTSPFFVTQTTGIVVMDYRLIQITDTVGRTIDLFYNPDGRLTKIKDFTNRVLTYDYSPEGDLVSFAEVPPGGLGAGETLMGYKTTYTYTNHNLETITDAKGQVYLQNVYDPNTDRLTQQTYGDPLESGGITNVSYEELANQTTVIDRKGFKTIWTFNPDSQPIRKEVFTHGIRPGDPASYVTTYEYNADLEQTKITYPNGNVTDFGYDGQGNLLSITRKGTTPNPDIVTTFTYESQFNQVKTNTDPRGNVTTYTYDYEVGGGTNGNLVNIAFPSVDAATIETNFTYNASGQLETTTDPKGNVTKNTYYLATGYLQTITNGFGTVDAAVMAMTYDAVGNVKTVQDPRSNTTTFDYDVNNNLKQVTAPAPFSYLTKYTYDLNGNLEKTERQSDFGFQTTQYTYTALDQLKTITDHQLNVTSFQYDPNGNRKKIIDAELKETNYLYDERDLLFQVTDANAGGTSYTYDANGNLTTIDDAKTNTTSYTYDEFDRLKETIYPDTSIETYTYDAASNLATKTSPKSEVITYTYDELNRLTLKEYTGCAVSICGGDVDYVYDVGGRLDQVLNNNATIDYVYDVLNRAKQVTTNLSGSNFIVSYDYDLAGNRTELVYPHGRTITYQYDELNRLDTISDIGVLYDFDYDTLSRRSSLSRPNGVSTSYTYDTLNRLTQIAHGAIATIGYPLYDKVGNRKQMTDSLGTHTYGYDNIYQLTSASGATTASYNYDSVGNRTTASGTGIPSTYTPNNLNQYSSVDAVSYSYDSNGNLTNDGDQIYEYDFENRLIRVTPAPPNTSLRGSAATEAIYAYDPFGRRLSKTYDVPLTTDNFLYDGDQIIEQRDAILTLTQSFLYGPGIDEPLELIQHPSLTTHYYHADGLGSITHFTDSSGIVQESYTYSAFGIPSATSSLGNPYLFTGREYDPETSLYYYRARYYHPRLGEISAAGFVGGFIGGSVNIY